MKREDMYQLKRRELLKKMAAAGISVSALSLLGCAGQPAPAAPAAPTKTAAPAATAAPTAAPSGEVVDLEFFIWTWGVELVKDNVDWFNREYPEYNVRLTDAAQETYRDACIARFVGNVQTDLIYSSTEWQTEYERAGWIAMREDYNKECLEYKDDISPGYWPGFLSTEGKMTGLAYYGDYTCYLYNQKHLEAAGIDEPSATWEDVVDDCKKFQAKGISKYPIAAFFGSYGFWATLYTFIAAINPPQERYLFDADNNPVFVDEDGPLFETCRWIVDAIHKHKIMSQATVPYTDPDCINTMGAGTHSIMLEPRYDFGATNDPSMAEYPNIKQAMMPGTEYTCCWLRPYNLPIMNVERGDDAIEAAWKLEVFFGGKTDEELEPDHKNGDYKVCKRIAIEKAVGFPYKSLWNDPDVVEAYNKFGDIDIMKKQADKAYLHQVDGEQVPWWGKWSGGWGSGFARSQLEGLFMGQSGTSDSDIMKVLQAIEDKWKELMK